MCNCLYPPSSKGVSYLASCAEQGARSWDGCVKPPLPGPALLQPRSFPRNKTNPVCASVPVVQLSHPAYHVQVLAGEQPRGQEDRAVRAACGSHHQHGRHRALRGRGRHLHRPGEQLRAGLWPDHHHKVHTTHPTCWGLQRIMESAELEGSRQGHHLVESEA